MPECRPVQQIGRRSEPRLMVPRPSRPPSCRCTPHVGHQPLSPTMPNYRWVSPSTWVKPGRGSPPYHIYKVCSPPSDGLSRGLGYRLCRDADGHRKQQRKDIFAHELFLIVVLGFSTGAPLPLWGPRKGWRANKTASRLALSAPEQTTIRGVTLSPVEARYRKTPWAKSNV